MYSSTRKPVRFCIVHRLTAKHAVSDYAIIGKWKKQREKFETAHDADLRLFYTARRILKEKLGGKPITLTAWKQEYDRLQAEYAMLSPQYKPLREDLMKMRRVQYHLDRALQRRQPEQEAPKKKQDIEL